MLGAMFWASLFPRRLIHPNCTNLVASSTPSTPGNSTVLVYCFGTTQAATVALTPAGRTYPSTKTVPSFDLPLGYLELILVPSQCGFTSGAEQPLKSGEIVVLSVVPRWYYCARVNTDNLSDKTLGPFTIAWSLGEWGSIPPGPSKGFTMSAEPISITILTGSSGTLRVTVASFGGHGDTISFLGDVNPDEENAPTVLFDPDIITLAPDGSNSTQLTIFVSANTPAKTYYVTVLGFGEGYLSGTPQVEIIVRTS